MNAIERAVETRVIAPARQAGYELPIIGTSEEPQGEVLWQAPSGHWWLFRDHESDPSAERYGGVVVPDDQREKLEELLRNGFSPDLILVGHEMPQDYSPGDAVPDVVPPRQRQLGPPPSRVWKARQPVVVDGGTALAMGRALFKATSAVVAGAVALGAALGSLDPVVLAGVRHPSGAVTWVEVTRWNW